MTYFHIELDNKFTELLSKEENKKNKKQLIELKTFIYDIYMKENNIEDIRIKRSYNYIDFKI
jgi:hypothetical protein